MNDATKAKFAAILAEQERKAAEATAKKTGQPQAPKQATPPPQPQPAPVVVVKAEPSPLFSACIAQNEGREFYAHILCHSWYEIHNVYANLYRTHGSKEIQGYYKTSLALTWNNGVKNTMRIDVGNNKGDFNPATQHLSHYLENDAYIPAEISRCNVSFSDSREVEQAAILADQAQAAEQVQDNTTAPELSTMTSADLLNDTTPAAYAAPQFCAPSQMPRLAIAKAAPAAEAKKAVYKIVNYSEKAFAVYAENNDAIALRKIQDNMYRLGGKFNPRLKDGAGYIFSKRNLNAVTAHFAAK